MKVVNSLSKATGIKMGGKGCKLWFSIEELEIEFECNLALITTGKVKAMDLAKSAIALRLKLDSQSQYHSISQSETNAACFNFFGRRNRRSLLYSQWNENK